MGKAINGRSLKNEGKINSTRLVTLMDGTGMVDSLIVFETNAPVDRLKELEKQSCQIYIDGGDGEDVPIWIDVLTDEGYIFEFVDEHQHVTPYRSSTDWLEEKYSQITEHYCIENQPLHIKKDS